MEIIKGAQYRIGKGKTIYTVAATYENAAMLTWITPGQIGMRNRYIARVDFGKLVPA